MGFIPHEIRRHTLFDAQYKLIFNCRQFKCDSKKRIDFTYRLKLLIHVVKMISIPIEYFVPNYNLHTGCLICTKPIQLQTNVYAANV